MIRFDVRSALPVPVLIALLAGCAGGGGGPAATPTNPAAVGPSNTPVAAAETDSPTADPTETAGAEEPPEGGLALADADVPALIAAYEEYGFTFDQPGTNEAGENVHIGVTDDAQVAVRITESDNTISELLVVDYSAGDVGLEEMGFTIGIFEPDAQDWLVEQLEAATADPGTPLTATMEFEHVSMTLEAFTDDEQSIDLYLSDN